MSRLTAIFSAGFVGGSELFNLEFLRRAGELGIEIDAIVPSHGTLRDALAPLARSINVVEVPSELAELSRFDRVVAPVSLARSVGSLHGYASRLRGALRATSGPLCCLGFRSQLAVAVAALGLRRRVCWVVHEVVPQGPFSLLWALAARRAERIYAYSRTAGFQPALATARVSILPVRLELEPFLDIAPASGPPRVLGLVGDLFPIKNHLALIEVVQRLRASGDAVEALLIARDFSYGVRNAEYVRTVKAAVGGAIRLTSAEPSEMPTKLGEIDLLLHLTTAPESFGRVCVEAMAAGRPIIGFDHGAVSELVESRRTGILCPVNDLSCVECGVRELRRDRELFAALSQMARKVAYKRWGPGQQEPSIGDALAAFAQGMSMEAASEG